MFSATSRRYDGLPSSVAHSKRCLPTACAVAGSVFVYPTCTTRVLQSQHAAGCRSLDGRILNRIRPLDGT